MKSECERAASYIDSLGKDRKIAFLACLIFELTIAGRTCYSIDLRGIEDPLLLREINELQHMLSAQIVEIASDGLHLIPSLDLVARFLERENSNDSISREIRRSFIDAITVSLKQ